MHSHRLCGSSLNSAVSHLTVFFCRQSAVQMPSIGDLLRGEKQAGSKGRAHLLPDGASADVTRCRGLAGMPRLQWARPGVYDVAFMP